jgi:hypothetical protein
MVSWSVNPAETQVLLVSSPVLKGRKVASLTLTAEVETRTPGAGEPTGSVTFMSNKTLGTVALSDGQATLTVKPRRVINRSIRVIYGGEAGYRSSTLVAPKLTPASIATLARASLKRQKAHAADQIRRHGHAIGQPQAAGISTMRLHHAHGRPKVPVGDVR